MYAYGYYAKNDPNKEYYCVWPSSSLQDAKERFAEIKHMPLEEFEKLYEVERHYKY